ncbi:CHAT domain-containing protein [Bradyrhizobium sp. HKCCYLS2038]|uniref:CHAT domain-containing protein n=1 Tax=unclassified Bradyrhizobium TaxID=2631580 RepID=UPI003EBD3950
MTGTGIAIDHDGFELICNGERVGMRRHLDATAVAALTAFAQHYTKLLERDDPAAELLVLGGGLFSFLDGSGRDLCRLLDHAHRPVHFEIATETLRPSEAAIALLRAPWELLARNRIYLASDVPLGFSPLRRLGRRQDPPPLGPHRLGLVFMAAAPRGQHELDYEAEESAIMRAVGSTALDLLVEESGNPDRLAERMVELEAMQALHLGCHGDNDPDPVLLLEDDAGEELPTNPATLIETLQAHRPQFIFLSACLTAAGPQAKPARGRGIAQSLAEAMVDSGVPAVLGWDGSVGDAAAIAFAATLYDALAGRKQLPDAVAGARRTLLNAAADDIRRRDWHLARLWCGPQGGGAIVGGTAKRSLLPATHGAKEFLIKERQQVPVASHEMFVGRRRELQAALRALRDGGRAGVLLHGMGRLGKSSLAARVANRRRDLRLAVMFERYSAPDVMDALATALARDRAGVDAMRGAAQRVRQDPSCLEQELVLLLSGPCAQAGRHGAAVLLVIDDLERILEWDATRQHHIVTAAHAPVLRAVLSAFHAAGGDSRLLLTSRFRFVLDGLEQHLRDLPLPPLSEAAQAKLALRQMSAALSGRTAQERDRGATLIDERAALLDRVPGLARGNPGLQDLIGRKLVLSPAVNIEHATQALDQMQAWLAQGGLPSDNEVRQWLEDLAIETLINLAGAAGREALRRLTLFHLPVPESVAEKVTRTAGTSLDGLRDLGLVDPHDDAVDSAVRALAVNALVAARLPPLDDGGRKTVARATARDLFVAWSAAAARLGRPLTCDLELAKLGLAAEDGDIVTACGFQALCGLREGAAKNAAALGRASIDLLDAQSRPVPWPLLGETARAFLTVGEGAAADALLERGVALLKAQEASEARIDPIEAGLLVFEYARRMKQRGHLDDARSLFEQAADLAETAGQVLDATIARGEIANILEERGDLDEALHIRQQVELPVYDRHGDIRSRAVAMGQIANILVARGDLDEALRIRKEEQLPVFDRLGDIRSRTVTIGQIADILESRGDLDEAFRIRNEEELPVYDRLGDIRSRAVTMGQIADILAARGDLDEALRIRQQEQLPVFDGLGEIRERAVTMGRIADILVARGDLDEALRIRNDEELPVYERLGDIRSRAVTMGKIADILAARGDLDEALRIRKHEELPVYERLGDIRSRAVNMGKIADILTARGDLDEALRIRQQEALPVFDKLGDIRERAVTMGKIADILAALGDLDEALRIRKNEELPVFDRLGDIRARAATMGRIASVLAARGDFDEALRIWQVEVLPVYQQLGNSAGIAATLWQVAQIDLHRKSFGEALQGMAEAYAIVLRLGQADGIAVVGATLGRILAARGETCGEAREILQRSASTFRRMGLESKAREVEEIIAKFEL